MIRLLLNLKGVEYEEQPIDYAAMKAELDKFPFAQAPRCGCEEVSRMHGWHGMAWPSMPPTSAAGGFSPHSLGNIVQDIRTYQSICITLTMCMR